MHRFIVVISLFLLASSGSAPAQKGNAGDRALGAELNRDKAETRIDRLRQDQKQINERPAARSNTNRTPANTSTTQQNSR